MIGWWIKGSQHLKTLFTTIEAKTLIENFNFFWEITLCPPVVFPKNTLPTCGLKIGTLPT